MLEYTLDENILALASDKTKMHGYLAIIFNQIIVPMTDDFRKIMINYYFVSEAEIFTSDLHFKMFHSENNSYHSYKSRDGPSKHEDTCENLRS